jgi:pyrroloquinoline quinone (PQQ) biosynthesis protein C
VSFWDRLAQLQADNDVLTHPFYARWSAGELTRGELSFYTGEYRHAVVALAAASRAAADLAEGPARTELADHAAEETAHIALWDAFAGALAADIDRSPLPETAACAEAWSGTPDRPLLESLVALYAIESAQPAISATKLEGLLKHYGFAAGEPAVGYFELHRELDLDHAAAGRALIETRLAGADEESLLAAAESVLKGNWALLDGVQRAALAG